MAMGKALQKLFPLYFKGPAYADLVGGTPSYSKVTHPISLPLTHIIFSDVLHEDVYFSYPG
jgi:hypothetical protein